jgi:histidinol-phosphatase (PHP family)
MPPVFKTDYHVHPDYSYDAARDTIEEYCERALAIGLSEICFTPHYTAVPSVADKFGFVRHRGEKTSVTGEWLGDYIGEVRAADARYRDKGLRVFAGLEIDYCGSIHDFLKKRLTDEHHIDYMLGSVHLVNDGLDIMIPSEAEIIFTKTSPPDFYDFYFSEIDKIIDSGLFKSIAHIEGYKRYGVRHNPDYADAGLIPYGHFERIFNKVFKKGMTFEINLSLFRDGQNVTNPVEDVLKTAYDCGIRSVAIGSDAHRLKDLAIAVEKAVEACRRIGLGVFSLA